jgi:hypothetical protein
MVEIIQLCRRADILSVYFLLVLALQFVQHAVFETEFESNNRRRPKQYFSKLKTYFQTMYLLCQRCHAFLHSFPHKGHAIFELELLLLLVVSTKKIVSQKDNDDIDKINLLF